MTALDIREGCNTLSGTDNRLEAMLQGFVNYAIDQKLRSVKLENHLIRTIEDVTLAPRYLARMTKDILDNQDFIAQVATIVDKETEEPVDVE